MDCLWFLVGSCGSCGAQGMVVMSGQTPSLTSCRQHPRTYVNMWIPWSHQRKKYLWVFFLNSFSHSPSANSLFSPQLEGALIRQQLYNCARNEPDTVQQATLRGEDIIWCHGHKALDYSDTEKTGPPSKKKIRAKYKQLEKTMPKLIWRRSRHTGSKVDWRMSPDLRLAELLPMNYEVWYSCVTTSVCIIGTLALWSTSQNKWSSLWWRSAVIIPERGAYYWTGTQLWDHSTQSSPQQMRLWAVSPTQRRWVLGQIWSQSDSWRRWSVGKNHSRAKSSSDMARTWPCTSSSHMVRPVLVESFKLKDIREGIEKKKNENLYPTIKPMNDQSSRWFLLWPCPLWLKNLTHTKISTR